MFPYPGGLQVHVKGCIGVLCAFTGVKGSRLRVEG